MNFHGFTLIFFYLCRSSIFPLRFFYFQKLLIGVHRFSIDVSYTCYWFVMEYYWFFIDNYRSLWNNGMAPSHCSATAADCSLIFTHWFAFWIWSWFCIDLCMDFSTVFYWLSIDVRWLFIDFYWFFELIFHSFFPRPGAWGDVSCSSSLLRTSVCNPFTLRWGGAPHHTTPPHTTKERWRFIQWKLMQIYENQRKSI